MITDQAEFPHLAALDGWRGTSILLVLVAHFLPVGPQGWGGNEMAAQMGMAVFFTLSGFLITRLLLERTNVPAFLIRRFFRIVPLAWAGMLVARLMAGAPPRRGVVAALRVLREPPFIARAHLWSVCVEGQFYVGIALRVALFGGRGLLPTSVPVRRLHPLAGRPGRTRGHRHLAVGR